jgi:hypothetical protein
MCEKWLSAQWVQEARRAGVYVAELRLTANGNVNVGKSLGLGLGA